MPKDLITIQIKAIAINFEIRINDIPLFTMRKGRPTVTELPCNPFLFDGSNDIAITIWPTADNDGFPDHAEALFEFYQRPIDALRTDRILIGKVNYPPTLSSERTKKATLKESTKLKVGNEILKPVWAEATPIEWDEDDINEIRKIYKKYEAALLKKNLNEILNLIMDKDKQYANAFYITLASQQDEQQIFHEEIFSDSNFRLIPLEKHIIRPQVCANGKLVTLLNQDNRSPLQFYNKSDKVTKSFPIYIGKINNEFKILL
jgi:hypothetical protein